MSQYSMNTPERKGTPEGATHFDPYADSERHACWYRLTGDAWFWWCDAESRWVVAHGGLRGLCIGRLTAIPAIPAKQPDPAWTGEGLPPVGVSCEVEPHNTYWGLVTLDPVEMKVLGYHDEFVWLQGVDGAFHCTRTDKADFRSIRTPEQISADERTHNIQNACTRIARTLDDLRGSTKVEHAALRVIEAMIDAGYRNGAN